MSHSEAAGPLNTNQLTLWVGALLLYGLGDLVTTTVGLSQQGIAEIGPVAGPVVDAYGTTGLVGLKSATLLGSYAAWRLVSGPHRIGIPLGLVVVGTAVTGWNTAMIWLAVR